MFNLQGSEIIIVLLLALVVLGPEKLPDAMRKMGQAYAELKKMSAGFQSEFRAAVDEPLREVRETANVLRDSADFTKLQDGTRQEKPKSADMAQLAAADTPTSDPGPGTADGPAVTADSEPPPFADDTGPENTDVSAPTARLSSKPTPVPTPPLPFTGMSAPRPEPDDPAEADTTTGDAGEPADGDPQPLDEAELSGDEADTTR